MPSDHSHPPVDSSATNPHDIPVVLASQSPRRRELLTLIGIPHTVLPADVDETVWPGELPIPHCTRLARLKVETVWRNSEHALVIGSDTIVVVDGDILGKPGSTTDAEAMLQRLSGRTHTVHTAVAVAWNGTIVSGVETVAVTFRPLTTHQIAAYVATGEPMDKAGAYGIQGFGATNISRVDGDYFAVMGLPLARLTELIAEVGLHYSYGPIRPAP